MAIVEKRLYPRLSLRVEDGYFGNFRLDDQETLVAPIVNISAGGLCMVADARGKIRQGAIFILRNIIGGANFSFVSEISGDIRWIKQLGSPNQVSVGCRFHNMTDSLRLQLTKFVDSERMVRGQYD
ncbi:MAG: hypothetical protein VR64_03220 [Desulfatitalea sp. BRH_c12]|nr:MAG: hypothetical protein VR64_03220 [Desulfatitalea sp. BRH_c12]